MRHLTSHQSGIFVIASSLAFLVIAGISILNLDGAVDDAFIDYRYVDRFLQHKGLTYNDGEHVEGFTSLLWTLLLAGGSFMTGARPAVVSIWMNFTFILLTGLSMIWLLQLLRVRDLLKVACLFLYSISILYFKVVFLGLEFGLFTLLLILFSCFFLRSLDYPNYTKASKKDSFLTGFLAVALFTTRPETVILLPALLLMVYLFKGRNQNIRISLVYSASSFVIFLIPVIAWRLIYFGEFLPNSVIAKSIPLDSIFAKAAPFSRKRLINRGVTYIVEAYKTNPALLFTTALIGVAVWKKIRVFELSLLYLPILWQHFIIMLNGGDWMEYSRFITMFIPLFVILFILVTGQLWQQSKAIGLTSLFIFSSLYFYTNVRYLTIPGKSFVHSSVDQYDSYQIIGQALDDVWLEKDILIPEATGRIAYFMPNAFVRDPSGLTDKVLAHDPTALRTVFGRGNWSYSLSLKPSMIVLHYWPHQVSWSTLDAGYPEQFSFYCLPPHPEAREKQWLLIIIRLDKVSRYGPPLVRIGAQHLAYEDFAALEKDYLECNS